MLSDIYIMNRISLVLVCTLSLCHVTDLGTFSHNCFDLSIEIWLVWSNSRSLSELNSKIVGFCWTAGETHSHISVCCIIIRFHIITFYFNLTRCRIFVYWLSTDTIIHVPYSVPRFCFHHFLLNVSIIINIFVPKLCSSSRMKKKYRLSVLIHPSTA